MNQLEQEFAEKYPTNYVPKDEYEYHCVRIANAIRRDNQSMWPGLLLVAALIWFWWNVMTAT